jgi:hypothetical protein
MCIGSRFFKCGDVTKFVLYTASSKMPLKIPNILLRRRLSVNFFSQRPSKRKFFTLKVNSQTNAQIKIPFENNFQLNGFTNSPLRLFMNLFM